VTAATPQKAVKVPPATQDQVTIALARISAADHAAGRRAGEALSVLLAGIRDSCWPEIAWRFSRLGAGGCPIEFSFTSTDPALRYTVEPSGPETAPSERLRIALHLIRQLAPGATVPSELTRLIEEAQTAADLRWGAWVGGRHSAAGSSFKLYAELPRQTATASLAARWCLPVTAPSGCCEIQLEGLGYDLARELVEFYYRVSHLDISSLTLLLAQAGLAARLADLLDLLSEILERPVRGYLPPLQFGFSLATDRPGDMRTASLFCYTYEALGDDARCRSRILSMAERRGLALGVYPEMSAPLTARSGRHRHTVAAVSVAATGPPGLTIALSPPDSDAES
jgi:hypothetical protein